MSDDTADPVVEESIKDEVALNAEESSPAPDKQEEVAEAGKEPDKAHPLSPEGDRFKQVYARAKKAEAKIDEFQAELQREREDRIRLEERLKAKEEAKAAQPEYTRAQLRTAVEEGRITQEQADDIIDKQTEIRLERKLQAERDRQSSNTKVLGDIEQYKQLIPDVMKPGSESRQKYEREFTYLVRTLGYPDNYATQLAATRAAFGDLEKVKRSKESNQVIKENQPFMETHTASGASRQAKKEWKDTLDRRTYDHYEKMIKAKQYKDWKEAEAEYNYVPKRLRA